MSTQWIVHFTGLVAHGPFPTRRDAITWGEAYGRQHGLGGSFVVSKLLVPEAGIQQEANR